MSLDQVEKIKSYVVDLLIVPGFSGVNDLPRTMQPRRSGAAP